jgi:membrane-associated phospholipid phosphatase
MWIATVVVLATDVLWGLVGGWKVQPRGLIAHVLIIACLLSILSFRRYRQEPRVSQTVGVMTLLLIFSNAAAVLSYLVVSTNASLIDSTLSAWDRAIGFDWRSLYLWMQNHSLLRSVFHYAYDSLLPQLVFLVLFLGFTARFEKLRAFIEIFIVSSLATIFISGLVPAAGPWKVGAVGSQVDTQLVSNFEPLRDGTLRTIDLLNMQGLISIPSFHTVLAVLIAYTMWRTPVAYLFLVLNAATIISTPTAGGHYLVDILAGAVLVVTAIVLSVSRARNTRYSRVAALKEAS